VFTARYALSPYIKQIRFVFKGLNNTESDIPKSSEPKPGGGIEVGRPNRSSLSDKNGAEVGRTAV
jgi:hypothetical protein